MLLKLLLRITKELLSSRRLLTVYHTIINTATIIAPYIQTRCKQKINYNQYTNIKKSKNKCFKNKSMRCYDHTDVKFTENGALTARLWPKQDFLVENKYIYIYIITNFEKLKTSLTETWRAWSQNYRPNAIRINQFGLKIRKLRALENWKRPQTREVVRDGNPADQEVVRDGNMPTKRLYELEACRPRGRTNRKF